MVMVMWMCVDVFFVYSFLFKSDFDLNMGWRILFFFVFFLVGEMVSLTTWYAEEEGTERDDPLLPRALKAVVYP